MNTLKFNHSDRPGIQRKGFTLLEILVLVVILVLISKYFLPRFSEGSLDKRTPILVSNLTNLRLQLEKYKIEHLGQYPGGSADVSVDSETFVNRMVNGTTAQHEEMGDFGPYFDRFPRNPFADKKDDLIRYGGDPGQGEAHWCFDPVTGSIHPDDTGFTMDGTAHSSL